MSNIKLYVDFDRTLFDTDGLEREVKKVRKRYGISDEMWKKYVKEYREEHNTLFNMYNIMYRICFNENINFKALNELNKTIVRKSNSFIFDDATKFIKKAKVLNLEVNMLSFGDYKFQVKKIVNTKISKRFDRIIITPENKFQIDDRVDYENGIFFDDNPKDVEGLYERNPLGIYRIRREGVKYSDIDLKYPDIEEVPSLDKIDLEKIVSNKMLVKKM